MRALRVFLIAWWRWLRAVLRPDPLPDEVRRRIDKWDGTR